MKDFSLQSGSRRGARHFGRRCLPTDTLSGVSMDLSSSFGLQPTCERRSRSYDDQSLLDLSSSILSSGIFDMSESDMQRNDNSSLRRRSRSAERPVFLAHQSAIPKNLPETKGSPSDMGSGMQRRSEDPGFAATDNQNAPKFLIIRRRKPSTRRASIFG